MQTREDVIRSTVLLLRLAVVLLFWRAAAALLNYVNLGLHYTVEREGMSASNQAGLFIFYIGMVLIAGIALTERFLRLRINFDDKQLRVGFSERKPALVAEQHADTVRKRENSPAPGGDPMSLLTDEDIEELRAEFKDELRRRYLQGLGENASEPASFEALLEDRQQRKRR